MTRAYFDHIESFDRFSAFAGKACFPPWSGRPQGKHNAVQKARKTGLRWARSAHRLRCDACPTGQVAPRTASCRVSGFDSIKCFNMVEICSRLSIALMFLFSPTLAFAHAGHIGELAGHAHLLGLGLVAVAAAAAAAVARLTDKDDVAAGDEADPDGECETT